MACFSQSSSQKSRGTRVSCGTHSWPAEKVATLRRHLLEKEPISKLCEEPGLQPTVFYRWQKEFFENGAAAFQPKARSNHSAVQERIAFRMADEPEA